MAVMPTPLESKFLVLNVSLILALIVLLVVVGLVVGGLLLLVMGRRGAARER